jgi:hypothetical protein
MATRRRICRIRVLAKNLPVWRIRVLAKTAVFGKWVGLDTFADIRQAVSRGLAKLADIRQAVLRGLARLAKGEFGTFYANSASLASPANLASVG